MEGVFLSLSPNRHFSVLVVSIELTEPLLRLTCLACSSRLLFPVSFIVYTVRFDVNNPDNNLYQQMGHLIPPSISGNVDGTIQRIREFHKRNLNDWNFAEHFDPDVFVQVRRRSCDRPASRSFDPFRLFNKRCSLILRSTFTTIVETIHTCSFFHYLCRKEKLSDMKV